MKFISHLDMNRFMIKMIRRSKIPVWYSEGFNPHPYITFALPLSLGFESDYEVMDIRLDDDKYSNEDVFNSLKNSMPAGIELLSCADPQMKAGQIAFARYKVVFEEDISNLITPLNNFLSANVINTEKKTKKGVTKIVNLKEFIKDFSAENNCINLVLSAGTNNLNPKLILDRFNADYSGMMPSYSIVRTMLFDNEMNKFK